MASSALPSTVQVTEAAYRRLRRDFLFRPRGRFYLPRVGEAQTFTLLAGRS
jgi:adenylate cyclase